MFNFTKEDSRISLIAAGSALFGSLVGTASGLWGTYAKFAEDKNVQLRADRTRAYMQLKGQQAEYLVILQQLSLALDKANFYQARAAQQLVEEKKGPNYQEVYASEALQQERNSEHYGDELVACSGRLFKSIGLIELTFPPDDSLSQKVISVESILTHTENIFPTKRC